jgi:putative FmdB family regulatory protein
VPTYGYRCEQCGQEFDVWQRMSDEAKADCPSCGSPGKRLFFPAGIVFKGGGFYKTDSRKSGGDSASSSSGGTSSATPAKDTKPSSTTSSSTAAAAAD